jgi:AAA domain
MTAHNAFETIVDKLGSNGYLVRTQGEGHALAQCPAHEDGTPSLAVTRIEGSVLLHCHGGCDIDQVLEALGLRKSDLFDDPRGARYDYTDRLGTVTRTVSRSADKEFRQSGDTKGPSTLFRLQQVIQAVHEDQFVYLVEGEKDVLALESIGLIATTGPMGANSFGKVDVTPLYGAKVVAIVDKDSAGQSWAALVQSKLDGQCHSLAFVEAAEGKDAADHIAAGYSVDDLRPLEDANELPTDRAKRMFPRLDWHALWADEEEVEWIHDPLLPARRSISIYSAPKVGKSLLMLEMAVAVSRGETFLGFTPSRRVRVLYVDFENDPKGDVRSRLQAMGCGPGDLDHLDYLSFPTMAGLDSEVGSLELLEAVKAYGSQVVMVDTVSRAVDGEENSNDTWLAMYRHTGLKLKQAGVAMIRLDHSGKDEAKGTRGGSAKSGDVDAIWKLTRVKDDRFRLECTDSRMELTTKSLLLTRHTLPRLHHSVNVNSAVTERRFKVAQLVGLCDTNGIPADANRDTVRYLASARGIKASGSVIQEVVKVRKNAGRSELLQEFTPQRMGPDLLNPAKNSSAGQVPGNCLTEHETAELSGKSSAEFNCSSNL